MRFKGLAGLVLALVFGLAACSGGDGSGARTETGSDPDAWLAENCSVTMEGDEYTVGVGYALTEFTLYEYTADQGTAFISETKLPADTRVCFDQNASVETEDANGSGSLDIVPISWSENPEGSYIKRDGYGGDDQEMCLMNPESNASCNGDEYYFQLDPDKSAELAG